jgi:hypothetical protein
MTSCPAVKDLNFFCRIVPLPYINLNLAYQVGPVGGPLEVELVPVCTGSALIRDVLGVASQAYGGGRKLC